MKNLPLIFDLRRGSFDDGPGIRTTVFLKGCPLRCVWCHNPESMESELELAFYAENCLKCGECLQVCPQQAISLAGNSRVDRARCDLCGRCAAVCLAGALKKVGQYYPVEKLVELLLLDKVFYQVSGGGVTFSGGEPLLHLDYLADTLKALKQEGIHTAVQTAGHFCYPDFAEKVLPHLDLVLFDLKLLDPIQHRSYTGCDTEVILENFNRLLDTNITLIPRVPLIPGITASETNLVGIANFLRKSSCKNYRLLPFNSLGISKLERLGKRIPEEVRTGEFDPAEEERWRKLFELIMTAESAE